MNPELRKELYKEAQIIIQNDVPMAVLYYKNENIGINKRVKGFKYEATLMHKFKNLEL